MTIAWSWPVRSSPCATGDCSSRTPAPWPRRCRSSPDCGKPCSPPETEMAKIYRDEDYRPRPNGRGARPRTKNRPDHKDAVSGLATAVDRGRYRVILADAAGEFTAAAPDPGSKRQSDRHSTSVTAVRASNLRRRAIVPGDVVKLVGDTSGRDG